MTGVCMGSCGRLAQRVCVCQVDEVKNIMVDNIEKVLERGEKIELLVDKTDNLRTQVWQPCSCLHKQ